MKLSVIIVSYNVKHFLEQCLLSVEKAMQGIDGEVLVADNHSVDGSCQMMLEKFPSVRLIKNKQNLGFSKANNQCIKQAKGEYILLLNPDTLIAQDCFSRCLAYLDSHPEAGALGVKMIDGKGRYLRESKRGLPTPWVAFCKMTGLTRLFPQSRVFARYYLGHLSNCQTCEVEILAGAFMLLRRQALDKTGLLDEEFFMYGEDIDLSYRILQSGYKNVYFAESNIIHYKGESTKRGSLNYVKLFYKAMLIFSRKHFSNSQNHLFNVLIYLSIYLRALLSLLSRAAAALFYPITDALVIFAGFAWLILFWESWQFTKEYYPPTFLHLVVPCFIALWLINIAIITAYRRPISASKLFAGLISGSLSVLLLYALLNEEWRFSRAIVLLGIGWTMLALPFYRLLLSFSNQPFFAFNGYKPAQLIIIANSEEAHRITQLLKDNKVPVSLIGFVSTEEIIGATNYLGTFNQLRELISLYQPDELIFSGKDLSSAQMIDCMLDLNDKKLRFKIAPGESQIIIGSHSPYSAAELHPIDSNPVTSRWNRLRKRWLDLKVAVILLLVFPLSCWFFKNKQQLVRNCWSVIRGRKTWVSYAAPPGLDPHLPWLKPGILSTCSPLDEQFSQEKKLEQDRFYAKNYRLLTDLKIIYNNRKKLDR